jgi:proteasome lid subunit RPN8/RPN11
MIRIEPLSWEEMVEHARSTYPNECCGAMLGSAANEEKVVHMAVRIENAHQGEQTARYEIRAEDLLAADREARNRNMELIGIYHSHPDADAYFSQTDLKNSCPWYSFVVLSIKKGRFDHANSWLPDPDQTHAEKEELVYGEGNG